MFKDNFVLVIKNNNKILREKEGNIVYLPFNSEYSILLKNKEGRRALVEIDVDGNSVFNNKLIVDSDSSVEIKGFMRDMEVTNRFKFINKTKEIQDFRGDETDDSLVRVMYQFEKNVNYDYNFIQYYGFPQPNYYKGIPSWHDNTRPLNCTFSCDTLSSFSMPLPEEGITVKGSEIKQNYNYGNIGILEDNKHIIILQLKGLIKDIAVNKPITVKTKVMCKTCGRKNKSTNNFCYNCGTYLGG